MSDEPTITDDDAWRWLVSQPGGIHIAATVLEGTATHLRDGHGVQPSASRVENLQLHLNAHKPLAR